jgi:YHS domain-containing protein
VASVNSGTLPAGPGVGGRRTTSAALRRDALPRLIADELRLYGDLLGTRQPRPTVTKAGLTGEERDPVCGMQLDPGEALEHQYAGGAYQFCSETCRQQFEATPEHFLRATA